MDLSLQEVSRLVAAANTARARGGAGAADEAGAADAERRLEALFRTSQTLAVYGTLAPGEPNHHIVAPLGGEWTQGVIEGELHPVGWGTALGYRAFTPRPGGDAIPVHVLAAPPLATDWPRLDEFEGPEYRRILVSVLTPGGGERRLHTVANVYAAAEDALREPES